MSGSESWCFAQFSGVICEISAEIPFGNSHEGSIPFTRSIHYQALTTGCSKSAVR